VILEGLAEAIVGLAKAAVGVANVIYRIAEVIGPDEMPEATHVVLSGQEVDIEDEEEEDDEPEVRRRIGFGA
jgi:hypothetical protein